MESCHSIAKYFLALVDESAGDSLSNLKLQKLVYYAQGFHLATHGSPLFSEPLMAWAHGPVVPDLYRSFKQHGAEPIPADETFDPGVIDAAVRELLEDVNSVYGQFSGSKLRNMTHEEPPWKLAKGGEISLDVMREYFKTQLT